MRGSHGKVAMLISRREITIVDEMILIVNETRNPQLLQHYLVGMGAAKTKKRQINSKDGTRHACSSLAETKGLNGIANMTA